MKKKIKLLALDMDGTTLTKDKRLSEETVKWIGAAREAGITVIFATGRGQEQVVKFTDQLNLIAPLVLLNGSLVLDANGEKLEQHFLNPDVVKMLHDVAVENETWFWGYTEKGRKLQENWQEAWLEEPWYKFGMLSDDEEVIHAIRDKVANWENIEVTSSWSNNIEINPKGVTKATGVQKVISLLGFSMDEVMAIGDSLNDYPLFKEAGLSIAMENGDSKLKEIATGQTVSNEHDGVAKAIQKYLF